MNTINHWNYNNYCKVYIKFKYIYKIMDKLNENAKHETPNSDITIDEDNKPTCIIVLGMAGSGKTTFVQVLYLY